MKVIGVSGGIGCGKSEVLRYLKEEKGARVVMLDDLVKSMMNVGGELYKGYVEILGEGILNQDRSLNRPKIAGILFSDPVLLANINEFINPVVKKELKKCLDTAEEEGISLFCVESAILFDEHYDAFCDETWYIYADIAVRRERLKKSRGYDDVRIDQTMKHQKSEESFRESCTHTIDNSGSFEDTKRLVDQVLSEL